MRGLLDSIQHHVIFNFSLHLLFGFRCGSTQLKLSFLWNYYLCIWIKYERQINYARVEMISNMKVYPQLFLHNEKENFSTL